MWSKVNRSVALGVALAVTAAAGANGESADEAERRAAEARRWTVALALTYGFTFQNHYGAITPEAEVFSFRPGTVLPAPLREPSDGRYPALNPFFGASGEVMTPAIEVLPGNPSFFANAEILPSFTSAGSASLEGAATEFILPEKIADLPKFFPAQGIAGTGSRLLAQTRTMVYSAGLGVSFPVEIRGRLVRIRPLASWLRYGVDVEGRLLDAFKDDPDPPTTILPPYGPNIRFVELNAAGTEYFNAIGPGLEIEMELPRVGSFRPSLYVEGRAYRVVGNQSIEIEDSAYFDDALGQAAYRATWKLEVADWMGRAALGFRFRWVGGQ